MKTNTYKMKIIVRLLALTVCFTYLISATSCAVIMPKDSGLHKGWFKNPNNPHNPATTNPGKNAGKKKT